MTAVEPPITEEALEGLVRAFYGRARQDPLIGPVFEGPIHDWEAHVGQLTAFWSSVMLGSGRYHGRPLPAHARLPLTEAMFARWLRLWRETCRERFVPDLAEALIAKAERIAQSLQLALFFKPETVEAA